MNTQLLECSKDIQKSFENSFEIVLALFSYLQMNESSLCQVEATT